MHRIALGLLAACASLERSPPEIERGELARWIERYDRVRDCVISPLGTTIGEGASVAILRGTDCREPLAEFASQTPLDERSTVRWRRTAYALTDPSPRVRAAAIEAADLEIATMRQALGLVPLTRARTELPRLSGDRPLRAEDGALIRPSPDMRFGGGRILGSHAGREFSASGVRTWNVSIGDAIASHPTPPPGDGQAFAVGANLEYRIVLRRVRDAAYALWASSDEGRTWHEHATPKGTLVASYHEHGRVVVLVHDGAHLYRHFIRTESPSPEIVDLGRWDRRLPPEACRDGGHVWYLHDHEIIHVSPREISNHRLESAAAGGHVSCRRDRALVVHHRDDRPDVVERCGSGCSEVFRSPSAVRGAAALATDQTWIYAASKEGVVSIRREGKPERLWLLPSRAEVVAISVLDGMPYLVVDEGRHYRMIPVP
jgi:hypothetical protein